MHLTGRSSLYTPRGWITIDSINGTVVTMVAIADIKGRLGMMLTQIIITPIGYVNNQYYRRTLPNGNNNIIANGLYNTPEGWFEPNSQLEARTFDPNNPTIITVQTIPMSSVTEPLHNFTGVYDVIGLPHGVLVDGVSIAPLNVGGGGQSSIASQNYFFVRKGHPFQLASPALVEYERKEIEKIYATSMAASTLSQPVTIQSIIQPSYNMLLD